MDLQRTSEARLAHQRNLAVMQANRLPTRHPSAASPVTTPVARRTAACVVPTAGTQETSHINHDETHTEIAAPSTNPPVPVLPSVTQTDSVSTDSLSISPLTTPNSGVDQRDKDGEYGLDNAFDADAGELDHAASGFSFNERLMHFLRGEKIRSANRPVVEICLLIESGTNTSDFGQMPSEQKYERMKTTYLKLIDGLADTAFELGPVRQHMKTKLYRAQSVMTGERLWEKYLEYRSECRTIATRLPVNLARIPSGNQLHDLFKKYIRECYKKIYVSMACTIMTTCFPIIEMKILTTTSMLAHSPGK